MRVEKPDNMIFNNYSRKDINKVIIQFIKFGIVGASNTVISLIIYYLCLYIGLNYILSNSIAFIISVLNAYYWNQKYVFKNNSKKKTFTIKALVRVFTSYGSTFLLGTVLLILWIDCLHISEFLAPLINLCITIPLNFILNKFWAFR